MNIKRLRELGLFQENTTESNSYVFTTQPTNDLELVRLLDHQEDYYRIPAQMIELKKKQIILMDPSIALGLVTNPYVLHTLVYVLFNLFNQGFIIYAWTGEGLITLTNPAEIMTLLNQIKPVKKKDIKKYLTEQGIAIKDCYLADITQICKALKIYYSLDFGNLMSLPDSVLKNFLSTLSDVSIGITDDDLPVISGNKKFLKYLDSHSPLYFSYSGVGLSTHLSFANHFKRFECDNEATWENIFQLLKSNPSIEEIIFFGQDQLSNNIHITSQTLKSMYLDSCKLNLQDLLNLLKSLTVLEELSLIDLNNLGEWPKNFSGTSKILKELTLMNCKVSWKEVFKMFETFPYLEVCNLQTASSLGECPKDFSFTNTRLKVLSFRGDSSQLLLKACPNVEQFSLSNCSLSLLLEDLSSSFLNLKKGSFYKTQIGWQDVSGLQKAFSNMEELFVSICDVLDDCQEELFLSNSKLKKLSIWHTKISWKNISLLLKAYPQLEEFCLSRAKNLNDCPIELFPSNLTLKIINLHDDTISWEDVLRLLKASPHLKELSLSRSTISSGLSKDLFLSCPSLKKLNLSSIHSDWQDVLQLLKSFPNIEELDLSYCKNFGEWPKDLSLSSVKKISIEYNDINWKRVSQILMTGLNIEECHLTGCNLDKLPQDLSFLSHVKYVNLNHTNMLHEDLLRLEKTFPSMIVTNSDKYKPAPQVLISNTSSKSFNPSNTSFNSKTSLELDDDTACGNKTIFARQIFANIHPSHYRCGCNHDIIINKDTIKLKRSPLNPANKKPYQCPTFARLEGSTTDAETHKGDIEINENDFIIDEWLALPGLTLKDKLISIQTFPEVELEIIFDESDQLYYIRPTQALKQPIILSYVLEADFFNQKMVDIPTLNDTIRQQISHLAFTEDGELIHNAAFKQFNNLSKDEKLHLLISYFNEFHSGKLPNQTQTRGSKLLNEIIFNKLGVCRHRVLTFMALAKAFNLPAQAPYNDIHTFVEVEINGEWLRADLGGGDVKLYLIPQPKPTDDIFNEDISQSSSQQPTLSPENPFREKISIVADSMQGYVEQLIEHADQLMMGKKNALSILDCSQIPAFYTTLLQHKKTHCFYLPNLDHIKDKQTVIDNKNGRLHQQNSELKQFLQNAQSGDVLLVNWSNYQTKHVGYNSIVDADKRRIKGMDIPEGVIVIGLQDKNQIMKEDFTSRFRLACHCPDYLFSESLIPKHEVNTDKSLREVCFYDEGWQSTLLGLIEVDSGVYHRNHSCLVDAIKNGEEGIVLRNAPWHLAEFQLFITELLAKREMVVNGKRYAIPENFRVLRDDTPYALDATRYSVSAYTKDTLLQDAYLLNNMTFNTLFHRFQADQKLTTLPGLIAAHKDKILTLFVTQHLSDLQLAYLVHVARLHHTTLNFCLAPEVRLSTHPHIFSTEKLTKNLVRLIETNDVDFVSDALFTDRDRLVIPVDEKITYNDLTGTPVVRKTDDDLECDYRPGILTQALQSGKKVVLKGRLSSALIQELSPLFLNYIPTNGKREDNLTGELTIITDKKFNLPFAVSETITIKENEIWDKLAKLDLDHATTLKKVCEAFYQTTRIQHFHYTQLCSMLDHLKYYPYSNPLKPLLRARADYSKLKSNVEQAWQLAQPIKKIKTELPDLEKRQQKIKQRLEHAWYVFVAGSSGVGKSTTTNQVLQSMDYKPIIKSGSLIEKLKAWLKPGKKRYLFIDEANLYASGEFDLLEGLYSHPPRLLIDNVYYEVPPENRLIFAGNFAHYHGRQELNFIARHGNVITFKEFSNAFLCDKIMCPIFNAFNIKQDKAEEIMALFLKIYHHCNLTNAAKHPLTTRNLQMMVMRYATTRDTYLAAYDEVSGVLKQNQRQEVASWIKKEFNQDVRQLKRLAKEKTGTPIPPSSFLITKKRINPVRVLQNLMEIRQRKMTNPELSMIGSNGLIIEGNTGEGKSSLAIAYLKSQHFVDANLYTREQAGHKRYYHIQAGELDEIKQTLMKAFHEGAVVIIDEMNTLSLELLLNALLSGISVELEKAKYPGFFVIGTQNPAHYDNRNADGEAFVNRFQKLDLKDYDEKDLRAITSSILADVNQADKLVDYYYEAQRYYANRQQSFPVPRDLFEKACAAVP